MNRINPFLKWAGGKRWLIASDFEFIPNNFNTYFEPFLGSGAVYFHLQPNKATLSDTNKDLIDTYNAIKHDWKEVVKELRYHQRNHSHEYYYKIRDYNPIKLSKKAARFIYLNRTCWNGLYRVNLNGKFNVPIGTKQNVILETDNFEEISIKLKDARIFHSDFETTINKAKENDFIYVDPPYTIKHNTNGFIKYNEQLFSWDDQIRLRDSVVRAKNRGAHVIISNADHASIRELYKDKGIFYPLKRNSIISGNPTYRGKYEELVIKLR